MSDFLLTADNDIALTNFDFSLVTGSNEMAQRILIKLKLYQGELFYNAKFGTPYYQEILGKNRDINVVESVIKQTIVSVNGVKRLLEFSMDYTPGKRELVISFLVQLSSDEELSLLEVAL